MKVAVPPAHHDLDEVVQCGEGRRQRYVKFPPDQRLGAFQFDANAGDWLDHGIGHSQLRPAPSIYWMDRHADNHRPSTTRREALAAQRSSGIARVSYDGKTVDYRSVAEIDRAIEALDREIAAAEGRRIVRQVRVTTAKGL